jgi:hypothetical protein
MKAAACLEGVTKSGAVTMRLLCAWLIAAVVLSLAGCGESAQSPTKDVYVVFEVESDFQNDMVTLYLDYTTLLQSRITTNPVLSLAWSSGLQKLSNDGHFLYFAVSEQGAHGGYSLDLKDDLSTVTINFDRSTKQVIFRQYKGRLLRD